MIGRNKIKINFELKGTIECKSVDDALNTLEMMQMDYDLSSVRLEIQGKYESDKEPTYDVDIVCRKK